MPIPQTTFGQYMEPAYAGLIADSAFHDVMSYSAGTAIPYGRAVVLGANRERQVNAAGTGVGQGALVVGIAAASYVAETAYPFTSSDPAYAITETVSVLKRGRIWMRTNDAVVAGSVANLVLANGNVTDEAVAAGIEAFTQFRATFITGTTAAGLAIVEID